jgi:Holliday junction resolvase RusA-like endonuclease
MGGGIILSNFLDELVTKYNFESKDMKRVLDKFNQIKKTSKIKSIEFFIDHEPRPAQRPRSGKYSFYVPDAAKNKKEIQKLIVDQIPEGFVKIQTEVYMDIKCYIPMLEGFSKTDKYLAEKGIIRPTTKPDVDNLEKTYLDALNGYIWCDDGQIVDGRTRKYYSVHPRVEVKIKYRNIFLSALLEGYMRKRLENEGIVAIKKDKEKAEKEKLKIEKREAKKAENQKAKLAKTKKGGLKRGK